MAIDFTAREAELVNRAQNGDRNAFSVTALIAALVSAIPALVLFGIFSLFLTGPLPWIAAGLFVLPLFFTIAFSPWLLIGSWKEVYTSTVWTLTYREVNACRLSYPIPLWEQ